MTYIVPKKVYYIHIPKAGGTTEKYKLKELYGNDMKEVTTGKHSPYDKQYADYDCIYTHVRNPHDRLLSIYLFWFELKFMPQKHITDKRIDFMQYEHKQRISQNFGHYMGGMSKFDTMLYNKITPLIQDNNPENYYKWLDTVGKANDEMDCFFEYRPWLQQHLWLADNVFVKKIEDEGGEKLNITSRMPEHDDNDYLQIGKPLIEKYYKEDLERFGYE
jgi:hypothetical protein|tara:strand:- start:2144 stop:2797 length:654 start_codon:yes stop_codon:yes gene_type:complete